MSWWALYVVTAAASCYAHAFAGFVILAEAVSLCFLGRDRPAIALVVLLTPLGGLDDIRRPAAGRRQEFRHWGNVPSGKGGGL